MTKKQEEHGWIQTRSGHRFDYQFPDPDSIVIEDIAHALSMKCRFNGHCSRFYSVAEHSIRVSLMLATEQQTPEVQFFGLMHDTAEAYLPDVPRPLKHLPEFGFFRDLEKSIEIAIAAKFGLPIFEHPIVKWADGQILYDEMATLMAPVHVDAFHQGGKQLVGGTMTQKQAKTEFLLGFKELTHAIGRPELSQHLSISKLTQL